MKLLRPCRAAVVCAALCGLVRPAAAVQWGADLSTLLRVQAAGGAWTRDGQPVDPLAAMAEGGWRLLRLRLWHTAADPWQSEWAMAALGAQARTQGWDLLLDFHYSDHWADPGHQDPPAAWQGLPLPVLADSVRAYTRRVLERFAAAGATPVAVQLGNEIDAGLLWPTGRVLGAWDTPGQWQALRTLLGAASQGVAEAFPDSAARPARLVHLSTGGWWPGVRRFLDSLAVPAGPAFEEVGVSYYPWWHGPPAQLQETLDGAAARYGLPVSVVETAYPFTLGWDDNTGNLVGEAGQLLPGYPATPEGQRDFLSMLRGRLAAVPGGRGRRLLAWEPAWIAAPQYGSPWENLCLFDFSGEALPALELPASLDLAPPRAELALTAARTLRLVWGAVPGAAAYRVETAPEVAGPWSQAALVPGLEWDAGAAGAGERGCFRVRALGPPPSPAAGR